jgi:hypothetical protein
MTVLPQEFVSNIGLIQFFTITVAHSVCHTFHLYSTAALGITQSSKSSVKVYVAVSFFVTESHIPSQLKS